MKKIQQLLRKQLLFQKRKELEQNQISIGITKEIKTYFYRKF